MLSSLRAQDFGRHHPAGALALLLFLFAPAQAVFSLDKVPASPVSADRSALIPRAGLSVTTDRPCQGQTLEVSFLTGGDPSGLPALRFNGQEYKLFPTAPGTGDLHKLQALIAVPADLAPGKYQLVLGSEKREIQVLPGNFAVQHLHLPKSKDNFDESPGEKEAVERAKNTVSEQRSWQGKFIPPSTARISAGYGLRRVVNGRLLKDYFHSGLDFAAPQGSPVHATAGGKIVLAATGFKLHGNVVAIDHGQGVISFYIHLQKILVKVGQEVQGRQLIGLVGHSGRANGPHLHFSLYVNRVAANPGDWFQKTF